MSRSTVSLLVAVALGQLVGLLGWVDPLFVPLVLVGPPAVGAVAASRGVRAAWPALLWFSAGINMLWTDWLVNHEDVAFHAGLSVAMAGLALAGWAIVRLATRRRRLAQS